MNDTTQAGHKAARTGRTLDGRTEFERNLILANVDSETTILALLANPLTETEA